MENIKYSKICNKRKNYINQLANLKNYEIFKKNKRINTLIGAILNLNYIILNCKIIFIYFEKTLMESQNFVLN